MMERRSFLKAMAGVAAFAAMAGSAAAAPIFVKKPDRELPGPVDAQPALATDTDVEGARVEEVRWGRRRGWGFGRRGWGRRRWGWGRRRRRIFWRPRRRRVWFRRRRWRRVRYW